MARLASSRRSEQLSYRKFFDPSYGLKVMNFLKILSFSGLFEINRNDYDISNTPG
jgi:hypothetical protein